MSYPGGVGSATLTSPRALLFLSVEWVQHSTANLSPQYHRAS